MVSLIIPTYQAGAYLDAQLRVLARQRPSLDALLVIDSSSTDDTRGIAARHGAGVVVIPKQEFDHGGTRTLAGRLHCSGDILVYLTQDAMPIGDDAIATLVAPLVSDPQCAAVFGRQVPHPDATLFARHLREFNYPAESYVRTYADRARVGIKAAFCSNSFAAYRRSALDAVGWFKEKLGMSEDLHLCARLLKHGYTLRYVAEAQVYHSHNYSVWQDFQRYFDVGAFFRKEQWILEEFGRPRGEGFRYVGSEFRCLVREGRLELLPQSLVRAAAKLLGYQLGFHFRSLPSSLVRRLSMHAS